MDPVPAFVASENGFNSMTTELSQLTVAADFLEGNVRSYSTIADIDYIDDNYYACAFHNEPKEGYDSWVEPIKEFHCLGENESIEMECRKLGIAVCR